MEGTRKGEAAALRCEAPQTAGKARGTRALRRESAAAEVWRYTKIAFIAKFGGVEAQKIGTPKDAD